MTLKTVMESLNHMTHPVTYDQLPSLFNSVRNKIFPDFPIYNEDHRIPLENLILGKYLNREICTTPYAKWQFMFNQKLMEIMPYYNRLYLALEQSPDFNIFDDVNYTRNIKTDGTVTMNKGTSDQIINSGEQSGDTIFTPNTTDIITESATPQTELDNFLNNKYISSATKNTNSGEDITESKTLFSNTNTTTRSGSDSDVENRSVIETVKGKRGNKSYVELFKEYKDLIFSVDMMILDDLEDLFFMIY